MKTIAKIILAGFLTFAGANRVQSGIIPQQQIYNAGSLEAGAVTYALSNCKKTDMKAEFPTGMNIYEQGMLKYNLDYSPEEESPYFGSVGEFLEKYPGGIGDWLVEKRKGVNK